MNTRQTLSNYCHQLPSNKDVAICMPIISYDPKNNFLVNKQYGAGI